MEVYNGNLKRLLKSVERQFGRNLKTPSDFNELLLSIHATTGRDISLSTVKRMWGYVSYCHQPSLNTLTTLAQYVGFNDWDNFCNLRDKKSDSDFIMGDTDINAMKSGTTVTLKWGVNKSCKLNSIGGKRFVVIHAENIKLAPGDELTVDFFSTGQPLYMKNIIRGNKKIPIYIGAKEGGLKYIKVEN